MKRTAFTHQHYAGVLNQLRDAGFGIGSVHDYVTRADRSIPMVVLRHDVDRKPYQAERMARLEAKLGVRASYYFRCTRAGRFPQSAIELIADSGHEVGYHYENLSQCHGDKNAALREFANNLAAFRTIRPCVTVCAHGKPLSRHNNFTQMLHHDLAPYALVADATLSLADEELIYFTDTGGRWNIEPTFNHRDYVKPDQQIDPRISPSNTRELIDFLRSYSGSVYISMHPERWAHDWRFLIRAKTRDRVINLIKLGLKIAGLR